MSLPSSKCAEDAEQALKGVEVDRAQWAVDGEGSLGQQSADGFKEVCALYSAVYIDVASPYEARLIAEVQNHLQEAPTLIWKTNRSGYSMLLSNAALSPC